MNNARMKSIEAGLSGIAKKVLAVIPVNAAWNSSQIITEIRRTTGSYPDKHVVDGCLEKLWHSGLIVESRAKGFYSRIPHKADATVSEEQATPPGGNATSTQHQPVANPTTMDRLAQLAADLRELAQDAENIALDIEDDLQKARAGMAKFLQIKELFKD